MSYRLDKDAPPAEKAMQLFALSATLQQLQETKKEVKETYDIYNLFAKTLPYFCNNASNAYSVVNEQVFQVENAISELQKDLINSKEINEKQVKINVKVK